MAACQYEPGAIAMPAGRISILDRAVPVAIGEQPPPAMTGESPSSREYERLMAGETVSWNQIVREHPMLGTITVAQLVNAGAVHVMPDHDPITGATDFRLRKAGAASGK